METDIYDNEGNKSGKIELPEVFSTVPREDILGKAFRAITLTLRQPYGSSPEAGMRRVGHNSGANHGISRLPRVSGSSRGVTLASMVGGRSAHSPRSNKVLYKKINDRERKIAKFSAIAMTADKEAVKRRGHKFDQELRLPVVINDSVKNVKKVKEVIELFENIGIYDDVVRAKEGKKIRAGRGKMRGRRYKEPKSVLVVGTSTDNLRIFKSLPGVDTATPNSLSIRKLAPGGVGGRLVVFTEAAIKKMGEVQ
jgi:large subunit ribosomal protein L4e